MLRMRRHFWLTTSAISQLVQYLLAYIGDGRSILVDAFPVQPAELMAQKQWHSTRDVSYDVVFASKTKTHLIRRSATRVRADGSPIEIVSAFYALTKTSTGWKFFRAFGHHRSGVTEGSEMEEGQPARMRRRFDGHIVSIR
jgi:hypothetical protein